MDTSQSGLSPVAVRHAMQPGGLVVLYCPAARKLHQHEWTTHTELAKRLAALRGLDFGGGYEPEYRYSQPLYFVPSDTLLDAEAAALGVGNCHQLFGGVVPHAFVATKTITHGLTEPASSAPPGWSRSLSELLQGQVLPGYSAFFIDDIRNAVAQLFTRGRVRIKLPDGIGGIGQFVLHSLPELEDFLEDMDREELAKKGIVAETNLNEVKTYSVGQCIVGDLLISYCGTQRTTPNNQGKEVYGGSELIVARGDFGRLFALELDDNMRMAIAQACQYHRAAQHCYSGIMVSRANYDVAQGSDDSGQWHSGVLEQSWRIGGASAAEIVALEAFHADASVDVVYASTTEQYGAGSATPEGAYVYYRDIDDKVGPLTKFAQIKDYAHLR